MMSYFNSGAAWTEYDCSPAAVDTFGTTEGVVDGVGSGA